MGLFLKKSLRGPVLFGVEAKMLEDAGCIGTDLRPQEKLAATQSSS
jgi:hypothetical protein